MDLQNDIKENLHKIIDKIEDLEVLEAVYTLLQREAKIEKNYEINGADKQILDERLEKYSSGEMKFSNWKDVKKRLKNRSND